MYDNKEAWESMLIPLIGLLIFFVGAKWSSLYTWFLRLFGKGMHNPPYFQKEIVDIKKIFKQIANDWFEMMKLLKDVQDNQSCLINRLQSHMECKSETLGKNIIISLEEEFLRTDQRFGRMKQTIETVQEEILCMKSVLQTLVQKSLLVSRDISDEEINNKVKLINNFAQTENEIEKRIKNTDTENVFNTQCDSSKFITIVKKCLIDVIKDTKLHLSVDREEENRELQAILTKLSEDREDIKKTIIQAFSIAAEQAKKNFHQFGQIGEDAMHYIAVLNENTNKILKLKLEETDSRLKEILGAVNRQIFNVDAVRGTLENIDGQFDDIFQRVELDFQRNTEHCEEIAESLERTSSNWMTTVSKLDDVAKDFSNDTKRMKEVLKEMTNLMGSIKQTDKQENKGRYEIAHYDSIANDETLDLQVLSKKPGNMIFIYSLIQSCWENMTCMNNTVENGCATMCKLIGGLEYRLQSLSESVGRLDEVVRNVHLESLEDACSNHYDANNIVVENLTKSNIGNAGDGHTEIFQNISTTLLNATQTEKIQNDIGFDSKMSMVALILKKVCEKRNITFRKKEMPGSTIQDVSDVNEESSSDLLISNRYDNLVKLE